MNSLQIRFGDSEIQQTSQRCRSENISNLCPNNQLVVETGFVQSKICSCHIWHHVFYTRIGGWTTNPSEKICSIFPKVSRWKCQSLDPAKTLENQWILKVHKGPLIKIVMKTFPLLQVFGRPQIVAAVRKINTSWWFLVEINKGPIIRTSLSIRLLCILVLACPRVENHIIRNSSFS